MQLTLDRWEDKVRRPKKTISSTSCPRPWVLRDGDGTPSLSELFRRITRVSDTLFNLEGVMVEDKAIEMLLEMDVLLLFPPTTFIGRWTFVLVIWPIS